MYYFKWCLLTSPFTTTKDEKRKMQFIQFFKIFYLSNLPSLLPSTNNNYSGNKYSPNMVLIFNSNVFHMLFIWWEVLEIWLWKISEEDLLRWTMSSPRIYSLIGSHIFTNKRQFSLSISLWQLKRDFKRQWKMCFMSFNILHTCWQSTKPLWRKKKTT
jgi:hypothetical protein